MPFRPGQSGNPSGRPRGAKTRLALKTRESIWKHIEQMATEGCDANPFAVLIGLMLDSEDEHIRVACAVALADRLLPKLKAVELSGDPDRPPVIQISWQERLTRSHQVLEARRNGWHHAEDAPESQP